MLLIAIYITLLLLTVLHYFPELYPLYRRSGNFRREKIFVDHFQRRKLNIFFDDVTYVY